MKKATVDLFARIFSVLAPPPNMTVSQWADKYRRLSSESSAEPGRWRTSKAPYQREIMDAVCDMRVQKVVIMSAAQIGKTDALILNPIGYYMHYDPSPIMVMQPTIQMAETFSKDRLSPMLRDTPGSARQGERQKPEQRQHHFAENLSGRSCNDGRRKFAVVPCVTPYPHSACGRNRPIPGDGGQRGRPPVTCRKASCDVLEQKRSLRFDPYQQGNVPHRC